MYSMMNIGYVSAQFCLAGSRAITSAQNTRLCWSRRTLSAGTRWRFARFHWKVSYLPVSLELLLLFWHICCISFLRTCAVQMSLIIIIIRLWTHT